jgi:hypothetical protein
MCTYTFWYYFNKAKQLKTEAAQILADAKADVERMILGE